MPENPPDKLWQVLEQAVGAQYSVLRVLGRGGMGAVYLARERLLERLVAIKVLPSERADGEARERFLREARTAARLNHPGIVALHSFGELGDTLFYIMRFVDGESLEARLRREGTLSTPETRRVLLELSDALGYAHQQGVVHRDIKPDNVLIERDTGRILLTDFGVARHAATSNTLTGTGVIVGTPQYMSPEQASGDRDIDGRSDLYSLGLIGYRMLAGQLPFDGGTLQNTLMQHLTKAPRPVTELAPDAPMDLTGAVMKCLEKVPAARWQDAGSLRFAIAAETSDGLMLPDELERLPRFGTRLVAGMYALAAVMSFVFVFDQDPIWYAPLEVSVFAIPFMFIPLLRRARRHGLTWRKALAIAFWPLSGWSGWWPRALRPPGDVWDRLPGAVRLSRASITLLAVSFCFVTLPSLIAMFLVVGTPLHTQVGRLLLGLFTSSAFVPLVPALLSSLGISRIKKAHGLSNTDAGKLSLEPSSGSRFWERPAIAKLLSPARRHESTPQTPTAFAADVRRIAAVLDPVAGTIASDAVRVADELATAIHALDSQAARLNDPAAAAEQDRVASRLRALGEATSGEEPGQRQMRELLSNQLTLMGELEARREAVRARRDMLLEQLRTLWLQLGAFQAQVESTPAEIAEMTGRVRELCDSVGRRVAAVREAEGLVSQ